MNCQYAAVESSLAQGFAEFPQAQKLGMNWRWKECGGWWTCTASPDFVRGRRYEGRLVIPRFASCGLSGGELRVRPTRPDRVLLHIISFMCYKEGGPGRGLRGAQQAADHLNRRDRAAAGANPRRPGDWCDKRKLELSEIEQLGTEASKPTVKQHLAAIRKLFDYLTTGGILESNPASAVWSGAARRRYSPPRSHGSCCIRSRQPH
jgi:hypothetical protein